MNADAYIPEFSAPSGGKAAANGRGAKSAAEPGFDAALDDARHARGSDTAITDPRDRGIVPGGRGGHTNRPRTGGESGPAEGGGQPPETGTPAPETGGGLPPEQVASPEPQTGGGLPPQQVAVIAPPTGGGLPPSTVTPPPTGGGLPPSDVTPAPATGGGLPPETASLAPPQTGGGLPPSQIPPSPATGGGQPPETGQISAPTGGNQLLQRISAHVPPSGQAQTSGAPAGGTVLAELGPDGSPAEAAAKSMPDGKATAVTKSATPAGNTATAQPSLSPGNSVSPAPAGAANSAPSAATAAHSTPANTAPAAAAAMTSAIVVPEEAAPLRAILEKSGGAATRTASSGAPVQPGQSTAAMPTGQAGQSATSTPAPTQRTAAPETMRDPGHEPAQVRTERADAPPPADLSLTDSEFDGELTLQRQSADLRGAEAAARTNMPNGPRLPAHTAPAMAAQIFRNFNQGQRQFEIRMDPPELGRVEVKLQLNSSDNRVHAVLSAERPETLASLQRSSSELERALAEAGLDLADSGLEFELSQGGDQSGDDSARPGNGFAVYGDAALGAAAPDPSAGANTRLYGFALSATSGIDVRI